MCSRSLNVMVIFGATGDLTKRKLIPALVQSRQRRHACPSSSPSSASPRNDTTTENFRKTLTDEIPKYAPRRSI